MLVSRSCRTDACSATEWHTVWQTEMTQSIFLIIKDLKYGTLCETLVIQY